MSWNRPCRSTQSYKAFHFTLTSHPPWTFLFDQHFLCLPRLPFHRGKFKPHHVWVTRAQVMVQLPELPRLLLKIPHAAVPKLAWDKTTLPGPAMPPKGTFASLLLLQLRSLSGHCWQCFIFWTERSLGCLICSTVDCTGNLSSLHLSELLCSLSILYKWLCVRAALITPKSQVLLRGCTPTTGSAHRAAGTELQP